MRALVVGLLLVLAPRDARAADVWVDALHGDDASGSGAVSAPVRTVSRALALVAGVAGPHVLHVAPGRYDAALGETFPLQLAPGMAVLGAGAYHTVFAGDGEATLLRFASNAVVSDVTLRDAEVAVESSCTPLTGANGFHYLRRCVISDSAIGVYATSDTRTDHGVALVNSAVLRNGVGIAVRHSECMLQSVSVQLHGSVVSGNVNAFDAQHGGMPCESVLGGYRSVLTGNGDDSLAGWLIFWNAFAGNVTAEPAWIGVAGNADFAPGFVDAAAGDLHLVHGALAIDFAAPPPFWPPVADYHPVASWPFEASWAEVLDADGDVRPSGAAIDVGTDESVLPALWPVGAARVGAEALVRVAAAPGEALLLAAGFARLDPPLLGLVGIAPPWIVLGAVTAAADGTGAATVAVPTDVGLVGLDVFLQAFLPTPAGVRATGVVWWRVLPG